MSDKRVPRDPPAAPAPEATPELCVDCHHAPCICPVPKLLDGRLIVPAPASPPEPAPDCGIAGCLRDAAASARALREALRDLVGWHDFMHPDVKTGDIPELDRARALSRSAADEEKT